MKESLKGLALEQYKASLPKFTEKQKNIIVGGLLGDATLLKNSAKFPLYTLKFELQICSKEYIDYLYSNLIEWCGTPPQYYIKKDGIIKSYWFKTYGHIAFKFYADQFYTIDEQTNLRIKKIPTLIHRWLNPEVLAYWYMDDGCKVISGYRLNTQGFTLKENEILADALGKVFNFEVNIHRDNKPLKTYYYLYITVKSQKAFTQIVSPYILPCFVYKLHSIKE